MMPFGLGNQIPFFFNTFQSILMGCHGVIDTVNLFGPQVGAGFQFSLCQFLGLRSEERKTTLQGTIVLVQLKDV
ncbi:MAG: hypothetical protein EBR82_52720 [Caulobacteraceae bacterium]|nr:hypothetical protein [Caulobacteraceae bacterium]